MSTAVFGKGPGVVEETGQVVEVKGDRVRVRLDIIPACGSCGSSSVCHPTEGERPLIEVRNGIGAGIGDRILLESAPSSRIGASFLVFGLPIVCLLGGTLLGGALNPATQDAGIAGGIAGLALGMLIVSGLSRFLKGKNMLQPVAKKVLGNFS